MGLVFAMGEDVATDTLQTSAAVDVAVAVALALALACSPSRSLMANER